MKTLKTGRKLSLNRDRLRILSGRSLSAVAGGGDESEKCAELPSIYGPCEDDPFSEKCRGYYPSKSPGCE